MGGTKNYSYHNPNKKADSSDGRVTNRFIVFDTECLLYDMLKMLSDYDNSKN